MSTNHTPNYSLSQWERSDKVQMDDFNADNARIDRSGGQSGQIRAEQPEQYSIRARRRPGGEGQLPDRVPHLHR